MTNPPGSFIWYELLTTDLAKAADFYEAVAGLKIPREAPPGPQDYRMIGTPDGGHVGGAMELSPDMLEKGAHPTWLGYVGVDDVDATVAAVEAAGGSTQMAALDIPDVGRLAMVADPQGAAFYVMTPTPPVGDEDKSSDAFSPAKAGHVAWNELHTSDLDGALAFYKEQLGWEASDRMDMPNGVYQMFKVGGAEFACGGMLVNPEVPKPMWLFYFNVPDIDHAHGEVGAGGGKVLMGPHEIPGGNFITMGVDPEGATFAVVGPRKES
jgi:predicted enzyme related to lactoylglutathione lyase